MATMIPPKCEGVEVYGVGYAVALAKSKGGTTAAAFLSDERLEKLIGSLYEKGYMVAQAHDRESMIEMSRAFMANQTVVIERNDFFGKLRFLKPSEAMELMLSAGGQEGLPAAFLGGQFQRLVDQFYNTGIVLTHCAEEPERKWFSKFWEEKRRNPAFVLRSKTAPQPPAAAPQPPAAVPQPQPPQNSPQPPQPVSPSPQPGTPPPQTVTAGGPDMTLSTAQPAAPQPVLPQQPIPAAPASLEIELNLFAKEKVALIARGQLGKYAAIRGLCLLDTFNSEAEARAAAVQAWGPVPFLIKKVEEEVQAPPKAEEASAPGDGPLPAGETSPRAPEKAPGPQASEPSGGEAPAGQTEKEEESKAQPSDAPTAAVHTTEPLKPTQTPEKPEQPEVEATSEAKNG